MNGRTSLNVCFVMSVFLVGIAGPTFAQGLFDTLSVNQLFMGGAGDYEKTDLTNETYSISGRVTNYLGNGVDRATVSAGGRSDDTNLSGYYTIKGLLGGNYRVEASHPDHNFSRHNSIPAGASGINFRSYAIQGDVKDGDIGDAGIGGITINISGTWNGPVTTKADEPNKGSYIKTGLANGNYTVTIDQAAGYTFYPPSYNFTMNGNEFNKNFHTYRIYGRVVEYATSPPQGLNGVVITIKKRPGSSTFEVTTVDNAQGQAGYYEVKNLAPGIYTLTEAEKLDSNCSFEPLPYDISLNPNNIEGNYHTISAILPIVADFTAGPPLTEVDELVVNFTDLSTPQEGYITSWDWDFGDGGTSTEEDPSHTYTYNASAAPYTVSLTVDGPTGSDTETKTDYITVKASPIAVTSPPEAVITIADPLPLQLDGSGSFDPDNDGGATRGIANYTWTKESGPGTLADDGQPMTTPTTTYTAPLSVTGEGPVIAAITLAVHDSKDGLENRNTDTNKTLITVNRYPLAHAGEAQYVRGDVPVTLYGDGSFDHDYDAASPDGTYQGISSWRWDKIEGLDVGDLTGEDLRQATYTIGATASQRAILDTHIGEIKVKFRLTVEDKHSLPNINTDTNTVEVRINRRPTADPTSDSPVVNEGYPVTLHANGADLDPDTLNYTWSLGAGAPAGVSITDLDVTDPENPIFNAPLGVTVSGNADVPFDVEVSDGRLTATETVSVKINRSPYNASIEADPASPNEDDVVTLTGSADERDPGDIHYYEWERTAGPDVGTLEHLLPTDPQATYIIGDTLYQQEVLDTFQGEVRVTFEVTIRDREIVGQGLNDTATKDIVINRYPRISAGDDFVANAGDIGVALSGSASDLDRDALIYSWIHNTNTDPDPPEEPWPWDKIPLSDSSILSPTFDAPDDITDTGLIIATFKLTVTERRPGGVSSEDEVEVTINRVPTAVVSADKTKVNERDPLDPLRLYGSSSSDPDGDITYYLWEKEEGPDEIDLEDTLQMPDNTIADPTFIPPEILSDLPAPVRVKFKLTVVGSQRNFFWDLDEAFTGYITINRHPVADAGEPQEVTAGEIVTLDGTASSDPDEDDMTYLWEQTSGPRVEWLTPTDIAEPQFRAPDVDNEEDLRFTLTVTDMPGSGLSGLSSADGVIITVTPQEGILYVDEAGGEDYTTIEDALQAVTHRIDIIEVLGEGTYNPVGGLLTLPDGIILRARERRGPAIEGTTIEMADDTTLEGFRILSNSEDTVPVSLNSVSRVTVRHNTIKVTTAAADTEAYALKIAFADPSEAEDIYIHNNIILTHTTGQDCTARGVAIIQDDTNTNEIQEDKIKIVNNTIEVISEAGLTHALYVDANNFYNTQTGESGVLIKNNIITIEPGKQALSTEVPNYCIYKTGTLITYLPVKYNNLFLRRRFSRDRENNVYVVTKVWGNQKRIDPQFTKDVVAGADPEDYHLWGETPPWGDSPCIDKGDPRDDHSLEPDYPNGHINMGAYGNTTEAACKGGLVIESYNRVSRTRVGRTLFDYVCTMTLNNIGSTPVSNVGCELVDAPNNVLIIDPNVTFAYIGAGELATSDDTFALRVDRSVVIDEAQIGWFCTFDFADTGTSGQSAFTTRIILEPQPGDLATDGVVDSKDLARLISKWLWTGEPGGIPEDIIEDGYVDFLDFAALAGNWMK